MAKKAAQTMDLTQASQMLQWLEEERRNDKTVIAALQEQARSQEQQLSQQEALIQDLQTTVAGIQSLITKATEFDQAVQNYKTEMVFLLDQREEAWKKEQAEAERLRKVEHEAVSDHLDKLDKQAQTVSRHDEDLKARRAEEQRLSEAVQRLEGTVSDLSKRSDDRVQSVTYLEEQRRSDNRRIAELEQDALELRKRSEAQAAKLLLLEETIQKQNARIEEALQVMKGLEKLIEEMRAADFQREQKMKHYMEQAEQAAQEMERFRQQAQGFVEQHQLVKRALEKTESFQARIEKRQNEVAEMQRLAEDRIKRQWEEWQAAQDKEHKKRQIVADERWRAQDAANQGLTDRLELLQGWVGGHQAQLESLYDARRMAAHRELEAAQTTIEQVEKSLAEMREVMRGERK